MSTCSLPESYNCPINLVYTHWPKCWGVWNAAKHICCLEIKLRWASASSIRVRLTSSPASLASFPKRDSHMRLPGRFRCLNTSCCVFLPANISMHASVAGWNSVSLENSHELKIEMTLEAMELGMMWERMDTCIVRGVKTWAIIWPNWRSKSQGNGTHQAQIPQIARARMWYQSQTVQCLLVPLPIIGRHGYYPAVYHGPPDLRRHTVSDQLRHSGRGSRGVNHYLHGEGSVCFVQGTTSANAEIHQTCPEGGRNLLPVCSSWIRSCMCQI